MQYPYVSKLDAGTYEFLKTFGVEIVSSGDLISLFNAVWTEEQYKDNIPVASALVEIVKDAFRYIKDEIKQKQFHYRVYSSAVHNERV